MPRVCLALATLAATAALLAAPPAGAQGFSVYEHGSCTMGRAGAAVAAPCDDGSAIFFNPAGLAGMTGRRVSAGATIVHAVGGFTDDYLGETTDLNSAFPIVPSAYFAWGWSPRLAFGVGVMAPYGLSLSWPETFEGRFLGYNTSLKAIYFQPTVAYKPLPWLSVGGGIDLVFSEVDLKQRVDLSSNTVPGQTFTFASLGITEGTEFADADLSASGTSDLKNYHIGAIVQVSPGLSIGARYLSRVAIEYDGTADFTPVSTGITLAAGNPFGVPAGTPLDSVVAAAFRTGGPLARDADGTAQDASTVIQMPAQFVLGVALKVSPDLTFLADWQWTDWKIFNAIPLTFSVAPARTVYESYRETNAIRLGVEYTGFRGYTLRGGFLNHSAAAPPQTVTPLLPEGARNEFTAGIGFRVSPNLRADLAYQYIRQSDRRGRVKEALAGAVPTVELNTGLYTFKAHLFGATFSLAF